MKLSTNKIVFYALFISLSVVLKLLKIPIPIIGLTFVGLPIIMAGILFGPTAGGIVGGLSDIIGYIIKPTGPFLPHFTLTAILTGVIPGLVLYFFKKDINKLSILHYILAIGIGQIITSVIMLSYFFHILFGLPFKLKMYELMIIQLQHIPLYSIVIKTIINRIHVYNPNLLNMKYSGNDV